LYPRPGMFPYFAIQSTIPRVLRCWPHIERFCGHGPTHLPHGIAMKCVSRKWERAHLMPMSLKEQIRLLSMVDILGPLSDEEMEDLAKRAPDTFLEQGDILYSPQEGLERLFILKEGRVQLYEIGDDGDEITLSVVEDGNVFGEMALTGQSLSGIYVRVLTPSTVASLRREDVEDLILKKPEVGLRLVRELAERLRDSEARYADIVDKDVPARLATQILTLVDSEGVVSSESYRIPTHYTHEQLGSMIGCKRVAVTRAFRKLEEAGAVELKERHIVVKDLDALRGLAEAG
jgi:CRP/FNR family transcriptional regulator, cyclic AMP receptor protein